MLKPFETKPLAASKPLRTLVVVLAALLSALPAVAVAEEEAPEPAVELTWGVKIPMRDGVRLNATVYRPKQMPAPLPVIFTLTPYIADSYHERAYYFARHGYVFVLVDARGRGSSEGTFDPFIQEAHDGHDVVEWLAARPWSSGKVGMWGGSYAGYNQWATAKEFPPHLATIVPAAAAFAGVDFPFWKNIPFPYDIQWLTLTSGATPNSRLFRESSFWIEKFTTLYRDHRPFTDLPALVGNTTTKFDTWVAHPARDAYWDAMNPTAEDFARIELPILTITGHYDGDQPGAMEFYRQHMRHGSKRATARHYLIAGPWNHAGTRTPKREVGGLTFGKASLVDLNALHVEWYDWTMKDGPQPEFLKKRVATYVVGAEEWRYADSLDTLTDTTRRLYLASHDGQAGDVFHSGRLQADAPAKSSPPDRYIYDPLDTRPAELEQQDIENHLTDQREALNLFGNGLIYHSAPFEEPIEVSGYLQLVLWLAIDVPDTDFTVKVYEILPDGTSILLTRDQIRARYRNSLYKAEFVTPGKIERYDFDSFYFFSRQIAAGSRLRLLINSPNSIHTQKNYNSGGVVAEKSGADARTAHVTLYHDTAHPSYLQIPIRE